MKKKVFTILTIIGILAFIYLMNIPSVYYNLKDFTSNPERIKEYIISYGALGPIIIIIIQIIQVVISLYGDDYILSGRSPYGVFWDFYYIFGILLGSLMAFIWQDLCKPLVIRLIGRKSYEKYSRLVSEKYSIGLFILFILPFFLMMLCLLAGISGMNFSLFLFLL